MDGVCLAMFTDDTAPAAVTSPPGGRYAEPVDVEIHAGEAATIFYTVGGALPTTASASGASPVLVNDVSGELRFFAIDDAGNRQVFVNSATYTIDRTGPVVENLVAYPPDVTGSVVVAWSRPKAEDYDGMLVVRAKQSPPNWSPARGRSYGSGEHVAPQVQVVYAGDAASALDLTPAGGTSHYHAWAVDDLGNYSDVPASASMDGPLRPNRATLSISLSQRTVTVTEPPIDFALDPAGTFDVASGNIDVSLAVQNLVGMPVSNIKIYVESINNGFVAGAAGDFGEPLVHFGLRPTAPDDSVTGDLHISQIQPAPDPVLVRLRVRADPTFIVPGEHFNGSGGGLVIDAGEPSVTESIDCGALGNPDSNGSGRCALYSWVWAPDYELLYAGSRNTPWLAVVDPTTWTAAVGVELGTFGHVPGIVLSPDAQTLYALVVSGAHRRPFSGSTPIDVDLVVVDRVSLVEQSRVRLASNIPQGAPRGGGIALSADGRYAAAVVRGVDELFIADVSTMTTQTVSIAASPLSVATASDAQSVFVGYDGPSFVTRVHLPDLAQETLMVAGGRASAMVADDDYLYVAAKSVNPGLHIYELSTGVTTTLLAGEGMSALALSMDGRMLEAVSRDLFRVSRIDTQTQTTVSTVQLPGFPRGHHIAVTP